MSNQYVIDVFSKIFACYSLLLIICAVILNPLIVFVILRSKKLRSTSTFKLLIFSSINDLLSLLEWNQEDFTMTMLNYSAAFTNIHYCRIVSIFLQYSTLMYGSWMLVSISLDRLLSMVIKKWRKNYFSGARPYIYSVVLALVIIGINFNEIFTGGYVFDYEGTEVVVCYESDPNSFDWISLMSQIYTYAGFVVPYALLLIINSLIIFIATQFTRAQKAAAAVTMGPVNGARRKAQMTRMILMITFLYIILSLPGAIVSGYFFNDIFALDYGAMLINLLNAIQFTYPACSFFILFFTNKLFAKEIKSAFALNNRVSVSSRSNNSAQKTPVQIFDY